MMSDVNGSDRVLFLVNTYMQLITAIQLRLTLEKNAAVDLALSDLSVGAEQVVERLAGTGLFQRVRLMKTKSSLKGIKRKADVLAGAVMTSIGMVGRYSSVLWPDSSYDRIYYHNTLPETEAAYRMSVKSGKRPKCVRFDEGLLAYREMAERVNGSTMKSMAKAHALLHRKDFCSETVEYRCFYPSFFQGSDLPCREIPLLSRGDKRLVETLKTVFDYRGDAEELKHKYIFFGSAVEADGYCTGETELALQIAELVGKENLVVKVHPRDDRDVFDKYGITVSRGRSVPWEIIQLSHDFSEHVFLTAYSGSVLNASAMLGDDVPTYFLYPLLAGRIGKSDLLGDNIANMLASLQARGAVKKARIVDDLRQIMGG